MSDCKTWDYIGLIKGTDVDIDHVRGHLIEVDPDVSIVRSDVLDGYLVLTNERDAAIWARMLGNAEIVKQLA